MFDPTYLRVLAPIFSSPAIRTMAAERMPADLAYLIRESGLSALLPDHATHRTLLETIFDLLQRHYRCEYVYKNAIAKKILVGRHQMANATMATELRCDASLADLVILNGTSTVYEIKTELDNLDRLPSQIQAYRKMFDRIYVVAHENIVGDLANSLEMDIGILSMTPKGALRQRRASRRHAQAVAPECIFDSLRKAEYTAIVERHFGTLPVLPNTRHYSYCRNLFATLPSAKAHQEMVLALKQRFRLPVDQSYLERIPEALIAGLFGAQITTVQAKSLAGFMDLEYAPS